MPSSVTHAYIAQDVYKILDKKIKTKFNNYIEDYKTYSQGPDIFYFYNIVLPITKKSREIMKLGSFIHKNKIEKLLISLTNQIKETKNVNQFLFLCGLITHYITDSTIHPLINYKASLIKNFVLSEKDSHFLLETYLDNYMIKEKENINYKKFKIHEFCFNLKENKDIINLLNYSFKKVYNKDNIGNYYFLALKDMKTFFKVFRYDPTGYKRKIYNILNIFTNKLFRDIRYLSYNFSLDKDIFYLNLNHDNWHSIYNKDIKGQESFLDLYDLVLEKTKDVITILYEYIYEDKNINLNKLYNDLDLYNK